MPEPFSSPTRLRPWMIGLWLALAALTVVLAYWGWIVRAHAEGVFGARAEENAAFMALRALGPSDFYADPGRIGGDWRLLTARWTGMLVVTSTLAAAGLSLFRSQIAAFVASRRRNHTLVVGDHDMAHALVGLALGRGTPVIHVTATAQNPHQRGSLINLPRTPDEDVLALGRAAQACRVIIAETDLGASAEHALQAVETLKAREGSGASVILHLDDPATAERIHYAPGGIELFAFSEAQASARAVMLRHPPFMLARRLGASAAHILIVGFGKMGQELARDLALNSLVSDLGVPHITVIDANVVAAGREFLIRHPEFREVCRFRAFADLEDAGLNQAAAEEDSPPVCAAYVCVRDSAQSLSAAIGLRERSTRHELIQGPIFVRLRSGGLRRPEGGIARLEALQLYSFGGLVAAADGSRALEDDPDAAAKDLHEGYSRIGGQSARPWATLSEEMRISNRRAVSHVPAKLASLGFDLEPWLALADEARPWPPPLDPAEPLFRDEGDRRRIAALEHARWVADRRVNGWRHGARRDNARKIHPDLIAFEKLSIAVQAHDFGVADWMKTFLPRREGGLRRSGG